jgi:hypothetical protein
MVIFVPIKSLSRRIGWFTSFMFATRAIIWFCIGLWLGTVLDNNRDRDKKGRVAKGLKHGRAKLSDEQVEYIKTSDLKSAVLASMFGCTPEHIRRVQRGVRR